MNTPLRDCPACHGKPGLYYLYHLSDCPTCKAQGKVPIPQHPMSQITSNTEQDAPQIVSGEKPPTPQPVDRPKILESLRVAGETYEPDTQTTGNPGTPETDRESRQEPSLVDGLSTAKDELDDILCMCEPDLDHAQLCPMKLYGKDVLALITKSQIEMLEELEIQHEPLLCECYSMNHKVPRMITELKGKL